MDKLIHRNDFCLCYRKIMEDDEMKLNMQNLLREIVGAIFWLVAVSLPLQANATLFEALEEEPLFYNGVPGDITFIAEDGELEANSMPGFFNFDGMTVEIDGGSLELIAMINPDGTLQEGSFTVSGEYINDLILADPLLTGDLTGVMCDQVNGGECDFLFTTTGGSAYGEGLFPASGGVLLSNTNFAGWDSDFQSNELVASIGVPVPEPTTLALLSLGFAGLGFTRRKIKA